MNESPATPKHRTRGQATAAVPETLQLCDCKSYSVATALVDSNNQKVTLKILRESWEFSCKSIGQKEPGNGSFKAPAPTPSFVI